MNVADEVDDDPYSCPDCGALDPAPCGDHCPIAVRPSCLLDVEGDADE